MNILLTGGTGLIGRVLCQHLLARGHHLTVWSRQPGRVAALCGKSVRGIGQLAELEGQALDAVINLAGAPIADRPWSEKRKALLWASRVTLTEQLLDWLHGCEIRPEVLISGSAVGWYGDGGEALLSESQALPGEDFAARLCAAWEAMALRGEALGMRVVVLRTGLVLASDGGFLKRLLLPFRLGLGGRIGTGQQWMPWIHLADQIALIDFLLQQDSAQGPYNACAPAPVRNAEFTRSLAGVLRRPARLPVPGSLLRLSLGEMAGLLLGGQRVVPERLQQAGFTFRFTELETALQDLLGRP
ncbi:MAG: TIGR01777 family oxidoreductase [Pseudomonas sp.]|uniref:TIGR01777 family oxidoreductase n=1 Tax=Pseudomonas sp. TaxID=306 RepID=UPI0033929FEE